MAARGLKRVGLLADELYSVYTRPDSLYVFGLSGCVEKRLEVAFRLFLEAVLDQVRVRSPEHWVFVEKGASEESVLALLGATILEPFRETGVEIPDLAGKAEHRAVVLQVLFEKLGIRCVVWNRNGVAASDEEEDIKKKRTAGSSGERDLQAKEALVEIVQHDREVEPASLKRKFNTPPPPVVLVTIHLAIVKIGLDILGAETMRGFSSAFLQKQDAVLIGGVSGSSSGGSSKSLVINPKPTVVSAKGLLLLTKGSAIEDDPNPSEEDPNPSWHELLSLDFISGLPLALRDTLSYITHRDNLNLHNLETSEKNYLIKLYNVFSDSQKQQQFREQLALSAGFKRYCQQVLIAHFLQPINGASGNSGVSEVVSEITQGTTKTGPTGSQLLQTAPHSVFATLQKKFELNDLGMLAVFKRDAPDLFAFLRANSLQNSEGNLSLAADAVAFAGTKFTPDIVALVDATRNSEFHALDHSIFARHNGGGAKGAAEAGDAMVGDGSQKTKDDQKNVNQIILKNPKTWARDIVGNDTWTKATIGLTTSIQEAREVFTPLWERWMEIERSVLEVVTNNISSAEENKMGDTVNMGSISSQIVSGFSTPVVDLFHYSYDKEFYATHWEYVVDKNASDNIVDAGAETPATAGEDVAHEEVGLEEEVSLIPAGFSSNNSWGISLLSELKEYISSTAADSASAASKVPSCLWWQRGQNCGRQGGINIPVEPMDVEDVVGSSSEDVVPVDINKIEELPAQQRPQAVKKGDGGDDPSDGEDSVASTAEPEGSPLLEEEDSVSETAEWLPDDVLSQDADDSADKIEQGGVSPVTSLALQAPTSIAATKLLTKLTERSGVGAQLGGALGESSTSSSSDLNGSFFGESLSLLNLFMELSSRRLGALHNYEPEARRVLLRLLIDEAAVPDLVGLVREFGVSEFLYKASPSTNSDEAESKWLFDSASRLLLFISSAHPEGASFALAAVLSIFRLQFGEEAGKGKPPPGPVTTAILQAAESLQSVLSGIDPFLAETHNKLFTPRNWLSWRLSNAPIVEDAFSSESSLADHHLLCTAALRRTKHEANRLLALLRSSTPFAPYRYVKRMLSYFPSFPIIKPLDLEYEEVRAFENQERALGGWETPASALPAAALPPKSDSKSRAELRLALLVNTSDKLSDLNEFLEFLNKNKIRLSKLLPVPPESTPLALKKSEDIFSDVGALKILVQSRALIRNGFLKNEINASTSEYMLDRMGEVISALLEAGMDYEVLMAIIEQIREKEHTLKGTGLSCKGTGCFLSRMTPKIDISVYHVTRHYYSDGTIIYTVTEDVVHDMNNICLKLVDGVAVCVCVHDGVDHD